LPVTSTTATSFICSISVIGSDVVAAGTDAGKPIAWKNTTATAFPNTADLGWQFVLNNDVYLAGYKGSTTTKAIVWKNGVATSLTASGAANVIYVKGVDIYIAGSIGSTPTYCKNGISNSLNFSSSYFNIPTNIFVLANKVYVTGYSDSYGQGYYYAVTGTYNGTFNPEPVSNKFQGQIFSMYAVQ
jgi:hypothetical protein